MDDNDCGGLITYFRIDDEAVDFAIAVLDLHPFAMARRFRELLFRPVLNRLGICVHRHTEPRMMMSAHVLCYDAGAKIEQCSCPKNDHRERPSEFYALRLHMLLHLKGKSQMMFDFTG